MRGGIQLEEAFSKLLEASCDPQVDDPRNQLAELDLVIRKVEDLLSKLVLQRAPLKSRINQLNSPVIHLLPPEVVSYIFSFCLPDFHSFDAKNPSPTNTMTPFLLGGICRRWRDITYSTPSLWASLHIHLSGQSIHAITELVSQWLDRTGQMPLSIRISCEPKSSSKSDSIVSCKEQVTAMIGVFNIYSQRWQDLDIRIPTSFFQDFAVKEVQTPTLEWLHVDPPDGQSDSAHTLVMPHLPRLKKLHLSSVYLKSVNVQWENITHVYASAFYVDECMEIIRRCPQLLRCKLPFIIGGEEPYAIAENPLVAPSLKHLYLGHERGIPASSFLDKLSLPCLQELVYDGAERVLELRTFVSLLVRSSCTIRLLTIKNAHIQDSDFIQLMDKMPLLETLSIILLENAAPVLTNEVLSRLSTTYSTKSDLGQPLLPSLKHLKYVGPQSFSWSHFFGLMNSTDPSNSQDFRVMKEDCPPNFRRQTSVRAAKITLTPNSAEDLICAKLAPRFIEILEGQRYLDLRLSEDSHDFAEGCILEHIPMEHMRYIALRDNMRSTYGDPFADTDRWEL